MNGKTLKIDSEKLRFLMNEAGIATLGELAQKANVHQNTLTRVLRGEAWNSDTASRLAEALNCNPIDLQVTEGFPPPKSDALVVPFVT